MVLADDLRRASSGAAGRRAAAAPLVEAGGGEKVAHHRAAPSSSTLAAAIDGDLPERAAGLAPARSTSFERLHRLAVDGEDHVALLEADPHGARVRLDRRSPTTPSEEMSSWSSSATAGDMLTTVAPASGERAVTRTGSRGRVSGGVVSRSSTVLRSPPRSTVSFVCPPTPLSREPVAEALRRHRPAWPSTARITSPRLSPASAAGPLSYVEATSAPVGPLEAERLGDVGRRRSGGAAPSQGRRTVRLPPFADSTTTAHHVRGDREADADGCRPSARRSPC